MTIEEVKHADLQQAVKDINAVLGTKQNKVAGRQVLIDFIVGAIGGCIGPDPENPDAQIWTDERAGQLKAETLAIYETLTASAAAGGSEAAGTEATQKDAAAAEAAGQPAPETGTAEEPKPKECPEFGKGYDATDPACAKPCKRAEECQTVMAEAAATTGKKPRKTAEEKAAEKEAKKAEREAVKASGAPSQTDTIRSLIKETKDRTKVISGLASKIYAGNEKQAEARMKIYEKAYGAMGATDKKLAA